VPVLVNLDATAVDPEDRSSKLAGFTPPEAPVNRQPPPIIDPLSTAAAEKSSEIVQAAVEEAEPDGNLVVTSQETAALPKAAPPIPDNVPMVTFDIGVSAVTGIAEPGLPDIQSVEVNGERVPARERTAAEKKGSMFLLSMRLPAPYQHMLLETQPVAWAAPLVFPALKLLTVDGSPASSDKLQLPCNTHTRDSLRDGFMTLRIMRKTPETPPDLTDAELEDLQALLLSCQFSVQT
jgi:hypothetical protein